MKVLIIGAQKPSMESGTMTTICNLFGFLGEKNLMFITYGDWTQDKTYKYNISHRFLSSIHTLLEKKKKDISDNVTSVNTYKAKGSNLKNLVIGIMDIFPLKICARLEEDVKQFAPDVIYTYGTNITNFKIALYFQKILNNQICVHVMDNWIETVYTGKALFLFRLILLNKMKKCLKKGEKHFTISNALKKRLINIFSGTNWDVLINPCEIRESAFQKEVSYPLKFMYAGGIILERWRSLVSLGEILRKCLRDDQYVFDIYIPEIYVDSFEAKKISEVGIKVHKYVPHNKLTELYSMYDFVVLVESFNPSLNDFIKYSISTKLPEYMASNNVIFAYIPKNIYTNEFLKENSIGIVCNDENEVEKQILDFRPSDYDLYRQNQLDIVRDTFSIEIMRKKILDLRKDRFE